MKLTNQHRADIIKACIKKTFSEREAAYQTQRAALADALYEQEYGAAAKIAAKLPDGWCNTTGRMKISCPGFSYHALDKCDATLVMSAHRRIPYHEKNLIKVAEGDSLFDQACAVAAEFEALHAARVELDNAIRGIVYACTTRDKLMAAWPEGEAFFPVDTPRQTALVPYALALTVNKIMGLPDPSTVK